MNEAVKPKTNWKRGRRWEADAIGYTTYGPKVFTPKQKKR